RHKSFFFQHISSEKRPSEGALTLTVSSQLELCNGKGDRQTVRQIPSLPADSPRRVPEHLFRIIRGLCRFSGYRGIPWDGPKSFPLNGPGGFRRDIVDHAVDAAHFVDDAGRGRAEEFVAERV